MLQNLSAYTILLASNSPRRKELLSGLDLNYTIKTLPDIDESYPEYLQGKEIPEFLAKKKADAYLSQIDEKTLVITADTIVWLNNTVYGKPETVSEAKEMLRTLSGKTHEVITGVCLSAQQKQHIFSASSYVTFAVLTEEEIDYYVDRYKPMDKAGAYGVQEWIGYIGVENITGSYYNVMGLPIQRLYNELKKW